MMRTSRAISRAAFAAVFLMTGPVVYGQPERHPPGGEMRGDRPEGPMRAREGAEPGGARERIERRLQEMREETSRLEAMLRRMEAGGPEGAEPGSPDGPRMMRGRGEEAGRERGPLREAFREHVMEFLRAHNPEFAAHLEELRRERPDLADRALADLGQHLRELGELREKDPELFKIRFETHRVDWMMRRAVFEAVRAARVGGPEAPVNLEELRGKLAPLVEERFRLSLKERAHSVGALERRIGELREETARDEAEAARIVQERLDRLMEHVARMASSERPPFGEGGARPERPGRPGQGGPGMRRGDEGRRGTGGEAPPAREPQQPQHR